MVYPLAMMEILLAYKTTLLWLSALSLFFFLFSLAALPWILARIPETFFLDLARDGGGVRKNKPLSPGKMVLAVMKNLAGLILLAGGIIMLFIPGQGLLTMLAGLLLIDFPGKKKLLLILASQPGIQKGTNWIRAKKGVPPLRFPG
ncbi:MAG: hypothetical protein HUN04_06510 [Desulfobacter sp.]|nr:MAG: hypothetical protein HUN04_06510 [Desulfobacter sp.]